MVERKSLPGGWEEAYDHSLYVSEGSEASLADVWVALELTMGDRNLALATPGVVVPLDQPLGLLHSVKHVIRVLVDTRQGAAPAIGRPFGASAECLLAAFCAPPSVERGRETVKDLERLMNKEESIDDALHTQELELERKGDQMVDYGESDKQLRRGLELLAGAALANPLPRHSDIGNLPGNIRQVLEKRDALARELDELE